MKQLLIALLCLLPLACDTDLDSVIIPSPPAVEVAAYTPPPPCDPCVDYCEELFLPQCINPANCPVIHKDKQGNVISYVCWENALNACLRRASYSYWYDNCRH